MYKYTDNTQSNFLSFNQPIGLHMNPENRWVKMADAKAAEEAKEAEAESVVKKLLAGGMGANRYG